MPPPRVCGSVEQSLRLDVGDLAGTILHGQCHGGFWMRHGVPCRWRGRLTEAGSRIAVAVQVGARKPARPWEQFALERRHDGRWAASCPRCGVGRLDVYWVPGRLLGACWKCHGLRWERQYLKGDADRYRWMYRMPDLSEALALATTGTLVQRLRVLQAAEEEGLLPRRYTLQPRWQRR